MGDYDDIDPEGPSRADMERFGDEFVTCPNCKSLVYDQAELCQSCGHALREGPSAPPLWAIGVCAALLAILIAGYLIWG